MLISLVLYSPHQILKAVYIDFSVQNALQVLIIHLLSKHRIKFCFVSLAVECLRHSGLVRLIRKFGINLDKFRIDLFLKVHVIALGGRTTPNLLQGLYLVKRVLHFVLQPPHLFVNQFKLAVGEWASPGTPAWGRLIII